jgi:predicted enzyme related to lactoylglutathione lyase
MANRLVHLELHTGDRSRALAFYAQLCGWRPQQVHAGGGAYTALELGSVGGGVVECEAARPLWLPYVAVDDVGRATERARELGAAVLLEPREGPAGWRSVVGERAGAEIAFWQPKRVNAR